VLAPLSAQRGLRRQRREHGDAKVVSIVGYTNAGKSTLLRALTGAKVLVADQLFATLDPTTRRLHLGQHRACTLTDTVGFIRDLPKDLVQAFRATLEELEGADLLLHVIDLSDPRLADKMESVRQTLHDLQLRTIDELVVLNKSDTVEPYVARALCDKYRGVAVSAHDGGGLPALLQQIAQRLYGDDYDLQQIG
ncbi:MAG: GTPase HflX, partial [Deltaproteobacteria bacterium]